MKINPNFHYDAICCHSSCGPIFGGGCDIYIADNANTTMDSLSYLGECYNHSQYKRIINVACTR